MPPKPAPRTGDAPTTAAVTPDHPAPEPTPATNPSRPPTTNAGTQAASVAVRTATSVDLGALDELAASYTTRSRADRTIEGYASDIRRFEQWCRSAGLVPLPAEPSTVKRYIADMASRYKPATIARHLAAIAALHQVAGLGSPTDHASVKLVHQGIRHTHSTRPETRDPIRLDDLHRMVAATPDDLLGLKDIAVLAVAWWSATRRSELVGLRIEDLTVAAEGYVVLVRRGKTDQRGEGRQVALCRVPGSPICPVAALDRWLRAADIRAGHLFPTTDRWGNVGTAPMSDRAVARTVQRAARRAGLANADRMAAHSTRRGFISEAALVASEAAIANQSGHVSVRVLRHYCQQARVFDDNAATALAKRLAAPMR